MKTYEIIWQFVEKQDPELVTRVADSLTRRLPREQICIFQRAIQRYLDIKYNDKLPFDKLFIHSTRIIPSHLRCLFLVYEATHARLHKLNKLKRTLQKEQQPLDGSHEIQAGKRTGSR